MTTSSITERRGFQPAGRPSLPDNVGRVERWGSVLLGVGLFVAGLRRSSFPGLLMSLLGADLIHRGATGRSPLYGVLGIDTARHPAATAIPAQQGVKVEESITIDRPREEVYRVWQDLESLPEIMHDLVSVKSRGGGRSHWVAKGPMSSMVEWDAEIIEQVENYLISWRSLPGSQVDTAGSVHFLPTVDGRGTTVRVSLKYNPPAGKVGAAIASFLGQGLGERLRDDLGRFRQNMEAGQAVR